MPKAELGISREWCHHSSLQQLWKPWEMSGDEGWMECLTFKKWRVDVDKNIPAPLSHTTLMGPEGMLAHLSGPEGRDMKNI